jgi:uncharacterized tellurite resistance protein B-like protein
MTEVSYESIYPLIARAEQMGSAMVCTFVCPVSGEQIEATAELAHRGGNAVMVAAKQSFARDARLMLGRVLRGAFGYGFFGRMLGEAAEAAVNPYGAMQQMPTFSDEEKIDAIVAAFLNANAFVWDPRRNGWISWRAAQEMLSDFERQLNAHPIVGAYDRVLCARMLVAVASADGHLAEPERAFFSGFVTPELGSLEQLAARPLPSPIELDEASPGGVRHTLLMLAWATALTDEQLASSEIALLTAFATGLGIAEVEAHTLRRYAQIYLFNYAIERAFNASPAGQGDEANLYALASRLGLDGGDAERTIVQFRKRQMT